MNWQYRQGEYVATIGGTVYRIEGRLMSRHFPGWLVYRNGELIGTQRTLIAAKRYAEQRHQAASTIRLGGVSVRVASLTMETADG